MTLFILPLTGGARFPWWGGEGGVTSGTCLGSAQAGDTMNIAMGQMGNGSCPHAVSPHIHNARRKRFLILREREREEII